MVAVALNLGASWGRTATAAKSLTESQTQPDGYCGYWTFLPYYWGTRGWFTAMKPDHLLVGDQLLSCDPKTATTAVIYDFMPIIDSEGAAFGETVFVKTNCQTHKKLCANLQSPDYAKQFLPHETDPTVGVQYLDAWDCETDAGTGTTSSTTSATPAASSSAAGDIGKICKLNTDCATYEICNGGFCAKNPY
jgi:hypothetical protein